MEPSDEATDRAWDPRGKAKRKKAEPTAKAERPGHKKPPMRRYTVLRVIDGDTVEVAYQGGMSVRIIGIDTPETVSPSVPERMDSTRRATGWVVSSDDLETLSQVAIRLFEPFA